MSLKVAEKAVDSHKLFYFSLFFPVVMYGCESWTIKKAEPEELMLLNCGVGEGS